MRPPFTIIHTDYMSDLSERRRGLHLIASFPVKVRGYECGGRYCAEGFVNDLCSDGVYMRLSRPVAAGERLIAIMSLSDERNKTYAAPKVGAYGRVMGVETLDGGQYGVILHFTRCIFIYPRVAV